MAFIPPETIEKARQVDLLTYLKTCEPNELVHISGNHYCTREHDSLKISNGKWYAQEYHQITGAVRKVDPYWKLLQIGNMSIDFCEIAEIEIIAISALQ